MANRKEEEAYLPQEADRRRDATLVRMLRTPPKLHTEMKLGKPRTKKAKSLGRKRASAKR